MGDGPNGSAKWAKYSVTEDGKLEENLNSVQFVGLEFSWLFTKIENPVVAVDILKMTASGDYSSSSFGKVFHLESLHKYNDLFGSIYTAISSIPIRTWLVSLIKINSLQPATYHFLFLE